MRSLLLSTECLLPPIIEPLPSIIELLPGVTEPIPRVGSAQPPAGRAFPCVEVPLPGRGNGFPVHGIGLPVHGRGSSIRGRSSSMLGRGSSMLGRGSSMLGRGSSMLGIACVLSEVAVHSHFLLGTAAQGPHAAHERGQRAQGGQGEADPEAPRDEGLPAEAGSHGPGAARAGARRRERNADAGGAERPLGSRPPPSASAVQKQSSEREVAAR